MNADGYMTEEEFIAALHRAVKEICHEINGPVTKWHSVLKTTPPQSVDKDTPLKTYEDICKAMPFIYRKSISTDMWIGGMTNNGNYSRIHPNTYSFPQRVPHRVRGAYECADMLNMTVRNLGCRIFGLYGGVYRHIPEWLNGLTYFSRLKYEKITQSIPEILSGDKIEKCLEWRKQYVEDQLGPTDPAFIELWRLMTKKRIDEHNSEIEKKMAEIKRQLDELSAEIIALLEKIEFRTVRGELTNCADVSLYAMPGQ